jgi:hypothetical protein
VGGHPGGFIDDEQSIHDCTCGCVLSDSTLAIVSLCDGEDARADAED